MTKWDREAARVLIEGYVGQGWLTPPQRTELNTLLCNEMEDVALAILAEVPHERA